MGTVMVDSLDLMHCPSCGDFYVPKTTGSGRYLPHCRVPPYAPHENALSLGQIMEQNALAEGWQPGEWRPRVVVTTKPDGSSVAWLRGEAEMDWGAIERRVVENLRLTDVVDPPLTVYKKGFKMFGLSLWEIILLIGLATFLIWVDAAPAHGGQCLMSYCKPGVSERQTITNTHRQVVGDLYTPVPGQRTQIRDNNRRIIGYIERSGRITNTHRQKKGHLHD